MKGNFSPSINIIRDETKDVQYLPTNNSRAVYDQIAGNFSKGIHSFNIIGSYGTGKSAFLLALSKHLRGEETYFTPVNGQFNGCKQFSFINVVGQNSSFVKSLAEEFKTQDDSKSILKAIAKRYKERKTEDECLVLVIDEFGKFLEYAAKHEPEEELYLIQQIAEYASDKNLLFLTTLHQNVDAYSVGLSETQRKEWEKVKGRLKELSFNEPLDQLLFLAANYLEQEKERVKISSKTIGKLVKLIQEKRVFGGFKTFSIKLAQKLSPFDPLAALGLTVALQRYGQNERSLFTFLQAEEQYGILSFEPSERQPFYATDQLYDYLTYNYFSILTSKYNPDFFKWSILRNSLTRVEVELSERVEDAKMLVKTIGLLNILGSEGGKIDAELIEEYASTCLGITKAGALIEQLEKKNIVRYQRFRDRYKLFEGTDFDIENAVEEARKKVDRIANVAVELSSYSTLDYVPAKSVSYKKGTPRFFKYVISNDPITKFESETSEIDGLVNLFFDDDQESIFDTSGEPILYASFAEREFIVDSLREIKALEVVLKEVAGDQVAKRELLELKTNQVAELKSLLNERLFGEGQSVLWYYDGEEKNIKSRRDFNQVLSRIVEDVYPYTPVYHNELMNKTSVSSSIHTAKKKYIEALIENWPKHNLGFDDKRMPPEKTIYFSLLKNTGMHFEATPASAAFQPPTDESFKQLWEQSQAFLDSTKVAKRSLPEFIEILRSKPYGLKDGFIEFWLITFLFMERENFALFYDGVYLPRIASETAQLFMREAKRFEVKKFNIDGVRLDLYNQYRALTQQGDEGGITAGGFQATARPFLMFLKQIPKYSQQTKRLSHDAIAFRKAVSKAKELEKTFFEDLPAAFGMTLKKLSESKEELKGFVDRLNSSIAELRTAYDNLLDRVEGAFIEVWGLEEGTTFEQYQAKLHEKYAPLEEPLLMPRQKALFKRVMSQLPDRDSWMNSLVQALISKTLKEISDEEEVLLMKRAKESFQELDNQLKLSALKVNREEDEAYRIEISSLGKQTIRKNFILSKAQQKKLKPLEKKVATLLKESGDDQLTKALLVKLLNEYIGDDEG
jgi:hypothetical protein